jgi:hypothetical protein
VGLAVERRLEAAGRDGRHQALIRARGALRRDKTTARDERTLRRTLRDVHPDRFEPRLQATCSDVVRELLATRGRTRRA